MNKIKLTKRQLNSYDPSMILVSVTCGSYEIDTSTLSEIRQHIVLDDGSKANKYSNSKMLNLWLEDEAEGSYSVVTFDKNEFKIIEFK